MLIVTGYGAYQPAAYAAVKEFTTEKTAAMGYAMLYALQNLGSFASGLLSPPLRHASEARFPPNGITGVLWVYAALTGLGLMIIAHFLPRRRTQEAEVSEVVAKTLGSIAASVAEAKGTPVTPRVLSRQWLREHPLSDVKFSYFIFILIPVQTLFAHNWLTLPLYIERAFRQAPWVSGNFEFFSNLNPLLIFVLTPLVTALTTRWNVYKTMIVGTTVMAVPTFLLAFGPNPALLLLYTLLMSVGEALWQPRFLQYVAEIAPPGKTGMYMGVAQFPWFLTKLITGMYSGWFLVHYCPSQGRQDTEMMWLIYSLIACASPVGLLLAKGWVGKAISARVRASA
jgi:MFS family permease